MSGFTQREVEVPVTPPPSDTQFTTQQIATSTANTRSASSGFNAASQSNQQVEPAIPDSLFDALNREPPPSLNQPDWAKTSPVNQQQQPRASFSMSRPSKSNNLSAFPVTHNSPAQNGKSPLLPSLPPSSPLGFAYANSSPSASPARSAFNPASARTTTGLAPEESYTSGGTAAPRSPSGRSVGLGRQRSNDSSEGVAGQPKSRTQSMWNSVKFGGKSRSSSDDRDSAGSGARSMGVGSGGRLSGSSRSALGFATTSASPVSSINNLTLAPSADSPFTSASNSPTIGSRSTSSPRRPSATLAPSAAPSVVHRRPSAIALNKPSGGRDQGSKWLYEAQEAAALATRAGARKGSVAPIDALPVAHADDTLEASGEEDDATAAEVAARRRSGRRRSRRAGQSVSADDSQELKRETWGIRRKTEQYTHDLGPAALGVAYQSDAEESGTDSSGTDGEDITVDYTPETDQGELDGADGGIHELKNGTQGLSLEQYTVEDDGRTIGMPSPSLTTPRGSTSGPSSMLGSGSIGERRRSSAATVTGAERVLPVIERLRQMGPTHEEPLSPTQPDYPPAPPPTAASAAPPLRVSTADFVVAVVGPRGVGKSTVVRRGLKRTTAPAEVVHRDPLGHQATITSCHFNIANQARTIEVLEIDMALLQYNSEGVVWPANLPPCQGAMLCYDATDPNALEGLRKLLRAFWTRGTDVPLIVLACKADPELERNATDPNEAAKVCNVYGAGIVNLDGGVDDRGRKMKESFNWMVRTIMDNRGEPRRPSSAMSGSRRGSAAPEGRTQAAGQGNDSPIKPRSATRVTFDNPFGEGAVAAASAVATGEMRGPRGSLGLGLTVVEEAPVGATQAERKMSVTPPAQEVPSLDHSTTSSLSQVGEATRVPAEVSKSVNKTSALDLHYSKEDMIDKFLFAAVTGNDEQYVTLFLIVFRRFARPFDVLESLIGRFNFVQGRLKTDPLLSRFAQIKLCGVLSTWFLTYPGDFTAAPTYAMIHKFVNDIIPNGQTWVAHYATELHHRLRDVRTMIDPEASWALPDQSLDDTPQLGPVPSPLNAGTRRPSVAPSMESASSLAYSQRAGDSIDGYGRLSVPGSTAPSSIPSDPKAGPGAHGRRGSDAGTIATVESVDTGRGSVKSKGTGGAQGLLLELSNTLMDVPEERIALQITRIAWQAFAEMSPRDLMRHVLAPRDPKNPRTHLRDPNSSVMRSINFVNYLAEWVASMILVQSKAKWRARMLEKFITVAYALRDLENFDSLMGLLAGINRQTIHRLAETQELVNLKMEGDKSKVPKRLRSLNKLMSNQKSFSAYRLALANSGTNMVPYLGVHLQDITVVNEVKKDMRDGKVNWSKFSQMGRSAAIVLDCARVAPKIEVELKVEGCILGVPLLGEEQQYELSYAYQPRASNGSKPGQGSSARAKLRTFVDKVSQQN